MNNKPFAAVISCFKLPISPCKIFDCHPTDFLVVQVVGNLIKDSSPVRLEYAVENFDVPLIIVLGHQNCKVIEKTVDIEKICGNFPGFDKGLAPEKGNQAQKAVDKS